MDRASLTHPATTWVEFARLPRPGAVKTRLARTLGHVEAARIYALLAQDVHGALMDARDSMGIRVIRSLPQRDCAHADAKRFLPGADETWPQHPGGLGERLTHAMARAFDNGAAHVGVVGTDIVGLTPAVLGHAHRRLADTDVVVAPTPDGGYGFLVARTPVPHAFVDVDWSTPQVMAQTRARLRAAGTHWFELPGLRDVDVEADLTGTVPLVSVLVPAWNEAPRLRENLPALMAQVALAQEPVEVIVADGESQDDTATVAAQAGARVVRSPRGRGTQLAKASEESIGRWLWIVHADAKLAPGALDEVVRFCQRAKHPWGFCRVQVDLPSKALPQMRYFDEGRARLFRMPYGDQGVLVRRVEFRHVGGFACVPLMEDVILARRLARFGPPGSVPATLIADGRRWARYGKWGTTWRNWLTLGRFLVLRTDPTRLAARYHRGDD